MRELHEWEKHYSALDYRKVAAITEKFRDVPERLFGSFWGRNSNQNPREKVHGYKGD